jgi:hypothetical protein
MYVLFKFRFITVPDSIKIPFNITLHVFITVFILKEG